MSFEMRLNYIVWVWIKRYKLLFSVEAKEALKSGLSDMDYLRSKMAPIKDTKDEDEEEDDGAVQHADSAYESGDRENTAKTKPSPEIKKPSKAKKTAKQEVIN